MTRKLAAATLLFALCIGLCACAGRKSADSAAETPTQSASETQAQDATADTQAATEPQKPVEDPNRENPHIFDEMGLLSAQDVRALSDAADAIAKKSAIHVAVVMTEELGGTSPAKFAAQCYEARYPKGSSGFLVLINNETGEDYLYTSGACKLYLASDAIGLAIAQATPMLVEGKFREGIEHLLQVGNAMPELVYDSAGILSREQYDGFLTAAQELRDATKKRSCVLLIQNIQPEEEQPPQEALQALAQQQQTQLQADHLLVIALDDGICAVSGTDDDAQMGEDLTSVLQRTKRLPVTAAIHTYFENMK